GHDRTWRCRRPDARRPHVDRQEGAGRVGRRAPRVAADQRGPREGGRQLGRSHFHSPARRPDHRRERVTGDLEGVTVASTAVDLARVQFATTSIYHLLFVPLTLGLGPLVAIMQTLWPRTGAEASLP